MTRKKRLQRIATLAGVSVRTASQELAKARSDYDGALEKLEQFRTHRREYVDSFETEGTTMSAASARDRRRFIEQLDRIIGVLEVQVRKLAHACGERLAILGDETRRSNALDGIVERCTREDEVGQERVLQREIDERAGRRSEH